MNNKAVQHPFCQTAYRWQEQMLSVRSYSDYSV